MSTFSSERNDGGHDSQVSGLLLRELVNWGKKPASAEFQQRCRASAVHTSLTFHSSHKSSFPKFLSLRVELHKRRVLEQSELEQERRCEDQRRKKVALDRTFERIKARLLVGSFTAVPVLSSTVKSL